MKKKLQVPKFKNESAERRFWERVDLSEYFEPKDFRRVSFPNLKPTSRAISIRIPESLLVSIQERAHEINVPYQSLMKQYLARGVSVEREHAR